MKPFCLLSSPPPAQVNPLPGEEQAEVLPQQGLGTSHIRLQFVPSTLGQVPSTSCPSGLLLEIRTAIPAKEEGSMADVWKAPEKSHLLLE